MQMLDLSGDQTEWLQGDLYEEVVFGEFWFFNVKIVHVKRCDERRFSDSE